MAEDQDLNRKYLGMLVLGAIAIIIIGLFARDLLIGPDAPQSAPPSEASALQRFSQENQLRSISTYIGERVDAVAPLVVRVATRDASGVRWGNRDTLVSTSAEQPVLVVEPILADSLRPPFAIQDSSRRDWLLVVARDPGERVISSYGVYGGRAFARCGPKVIEKFVIGIALTSDFAGGGVFDLDGRLRGMVVNCGDG